jgi:Ca2+-binding EF-hand superfamily protein
VHGGDTDHLFSHIDNDEDGVVTLEELQMFFSRISHSQGSNSTELLIQYFTRNAQAAAQERPIVVLPVCDLLLTDFQSEKPPSTSSPDAVLSDSQSQRAAALFCHVDANNNGSVSMVELSAVWGGDSAGFFDLLDVNKSGSVSLHEWIKFFARMLQQEGHNVVEFALQYMDRTVHVQSALAESLDVLALKGTAAEIPVPRTSAPHGSSRPPRAQAKPEEVAAQPEELVGVAKAFSSEGALDAKTLAMVDALFEMMDLDDSGGLDVTELKSCHGGDDDGLFKYIDTDSDGLITLDEFRSFFSKLHHSKGSNSVALMVEYLRLNVRAAAQEEPITVLPVCQLLLTDFDDEKPASVASPDTFLSDQQCFQIAELFNAIDADQDGSISKPELAAVWGGDATGLFDELDEDKNGKVSSIEWESFFADLLAQHGTKVLEFAIRYFDRALTTQEAIAFSLAAAAPVDV